MSGDILKIGVLELVGFCAENENSEHEKSFAERIRSISLLKKKLQPFTFLKNIFSKKTAKNEKRICPFSVNLIMFSFNENRI